MPQIDLTELVDAPAETLVAEYKAWLDLSSDNVARANLARHIAAISNFGGGYIVLGFNDVMVSIGENPYAKYTRDLIASITKKYLDPSVNCEVHLVNSLAKIEHAIIVVPPHGSVPVCAKAGGPDTNGRPQGITKGVYYVRKTGPESAPMQSPQDWAPIIRRCALHERASILAALGGVLDRDAPATSLEDELAQWHEAARPSFEEAARQYHPSGLPRSDNQQLSYAIERENGERTSAIELRSLVRQINLESRDRVNTGWSMFYPFERQPIAPFMNTDSNAGTGNEEFLEADLWEDDGSRDSIEMWRVSCDGRATILRPIRGDFPFNPQAGWIPGKQFSPHLFLQELGEFVRHAQAHAGRFEAPVRIAFRVELRGLKDREIGHPGRDWRPGRVARSDQRITTGTWPAVVVGAEWQQIVATLAQPILRCFDPALTCTAEWVASEAKNWRPLGSQYP